MKHTPERLAEAVSNSLSWADVCRYLGVTPATGAQSYLTKRAKQFGISTEHFPNGPWNKGKNFKKKSCAEYLVAGSKIKPAKLRQRLTREGLKEERCEWCGLSEWMGKPIPLELDHINGVNDDNTLNNLRVLCCNCHALTDTYCGRNVSVG